MLDNILEVRFIDGYEEGVVHLGVLTTTRFCSCLVDKEYLEGRGNILPVSRAYSSNYSNGKIEVDKIKVATYEDKDFLIEVIKEFQEIPYTKLKDRSVIAYKGVSMKYLLRKGGYHG